MDKTSLSLAELNRVLASLKEQKTAIAKTKKKVDAVLESSSSCLAISGLDYSTIADSFDTTFNKMDTNLDALINVLENDVIKSYAELMLIMRRIFNKDFASKLSGLLGL